MKFTGLRHRGSDNYSRSRKCASEIAEAHTPTVYRIELSVIARMKKELNKNPLHPRNCCGLMRPFMVEPLVTYLVQRSALIIPAPRTKSARSEPKAFFRKDSFVMGKRFPIVIEGSKSIHDAVPAHDIA